MNPEWALNTFFGSALIIVIIFAECAIKYSINRILKNSFFIFLLITFFSLTADLFFSMTNETPEKIIVKSDAIRAVINYIPIFFAICVTITLRGLYKQINLPIILSLVFFASSMGINIMAGSVKFIWPVMAAVLLYTYLFIILNQSKIDTLTGLDNRNSFNEFAGGLSRQKSGGSWIIAILDIDNFKTINDIYGHLEGDEALRNLAEVIKSSIRKSDFAARYGGDEFILAAKAENGIEDLMASIREKLDELNERNKKPYTIEISYELDMFIASENKSIEIFLSRIDGLMRKHREENRRIGDLRTGAPA